MRRAAIVLALLAFSNGARADGGVVIVVPAATPGDLVDALRVELRARGEAWSLILEPDGAHDVEAVRALAAPQAPAQIVWVDDGDEPLRPPIVRLLAEGAVRETVLAAPLDAIDPRVFALGVTTLLYDLPQVAATEPEPAPATEARAIEDARATEDDSPPAAVAPTPPRARGDDPAAPPAPSGGFVVAPRVGVLGAGGPLSPFAAGAFLELDLQIADHFVFGVWGAATLAADRADPALFLTGVSIGGRAMQVPGTLTVTADAVGVHAGEELGLGPGLQFRWEWPIDAFLRIGPRVAGYALWTIGPGNAFGAAPDGWMVTIGVDVLGIDWRLL